MSDTIRSAVAAALERYTDSRTASHFVQVTTDAEASIIGRMMISALQTQRMRDDVVSGKVFVWLVIDGERPYLVGVTADGARFSRVFGFSNATTNVDLEVVVDEALDPEGAARRTDLESRSRESAAQALAAVAAALEAHVAPFGGRVRDAATVVHHDPTLARQSHTTTEWNMGDGPGGGFFVEIGGVVKAVFIRTDVIPAVRKSHDLTPGSPLDLVVDEALAAL